MATYDEMMKWPEISRRAERAIRLGLSMPKKRRMIVVGQVFGRLTVAGLAPKRGGAAAGFYWICKCDCGQEVVVSTGRLNYGKTRSCGCLHRDSARQVGLNSRKPKPERRRRSVRPITVSGDIPAEPRHVEVGVRVGRLLIRECLESDQWLCRCDCGMWKVIKAGQLRRGDTRSCGCLRNQLNSERFATHRMTGTRLYSVWGSMLARCRRPACKSYERYGARGIAVCDEWSSFGAFRDWALSHGYANGLQLDRIDNNGPYSSLNCRFVTRIVNGNNTRRNVRLFAFGEAKTLAEWERDPRSAVSAKMMGARLRRGWADELALTSPSSPGVRPHMVPNG